MYILNTKMNIYVKILLVMLMFHLMKNVVLASGILKGFDPLLNLVLDGTTEYLRGASVTINRMSSYNLIYLVYDILS